MTCIGVATRKRVLCIWSPTLLALKNSKSLPRTVGYLSCIASSNLFLICFSSIKESRLTNPLSLIAWSSKRNALPSWPSSSSKLKNTNSNVFSTGFAFLLSCGFIALSTSFLLSLANDAEVDELFTIDLARSTVELMDNIADCKPALLGVVISSQAEVLDPFNLSTISPAYFRQEARSFRFFSI